MTLKPDTHGQVKNCDDHAQSTRAHEHADWEIVFIAIEIPEVHKDFYCFNG